MQPAIGGEISDRSDLVVYDLSIGFIGPVILPQPKWVQIEFVGGDQWHKDCTWLLIRIRSCIVIRIPFFIAWVESRCEYYRVVQTPDHQHIQLTLNCSSLTTSGI